ncbi:hypothetical protein GQ600_21720 [Phytophthora cactorum]|nr:hypothetical protein GQ600_21720 [Phytophthora cactorum]
MTRPDGEPKAVPDRPVDLVSSLLRAAEDVEEQAETHDCRRAIAVFGRIVLMPVMLLTSNGPRHVWRMHTVSHVLQASSPPNGPFDHEALMSKPTFEDLYTATSWDYSILSDEALALAGRLEASGAICSGGVDEWGSPLSIITGTAAEVVEIIETLNLSVTPLELAEAKKGIETTDECITKWAVEGHLRLFMFQAVKNSIDYSPSQQQTSMFIRNMLTVVLR